jgi:hypothetical protein
MIGDRRNYSRRKKKQRNIPKFGRLSQKMLSDHQQEIIGMTNQIMSIR